MKNYLINAAILFLSVTPVYAATLTPTQQKTITIDLVHVLGKHSLSKERSQELINIAKDEYKNQADIIIKIKYFRVRNDRITQNLNNRLSILRYFERVFYNRRKYRATVSFAVLPPIQDNGTYFLAGYANGTCRLGSNFGVAVSNAEETNNAKVPRFFHSVVGFMHELGHLLGASHLNTVPATIMHSNALAYVDAQGGTILNFHRNSIKQIYNCLSKR